MADINLGKISYTNAWPITYFFDENKFKSKVEFTPQIPSQLNKKMACGEIDIGIISSFAYAQEFENYSILPDLSVSSYGNVGSISLFLKTDIEDIVNKKIALTTSSYSSVNLLKIIVQEFYGGNPEYISMEPNLDKMMEQADAALLIGDDALFERLKNKETNKYKVIDLGEEWLKWSNEWMTFAVVAIRDEALHKNPELVLNIYNEFLNSKELGYNNIDKIIEVAMPLVGGDIGFWKEYYNDLSHDFKEEQIKGLEKYFNMCKKIGVIKKVPKIKVVDIKDLMLQFSTR